MLYTCLPPDQVCRTQAISSGNQPSWPPVQRTLNGQFSPQILCRLAPSWIWRNSSRDPKSCNTLTMAVYFECRTQTKMPQSELFDLARNIDAHKDSMAQSHEEAVDGVTSGLISLGEEVTWRAWHFGVPLQMTSRIIEMQIPDYFVDEQVKGPFRRFRHVHEFSEDSAGTTMVDRIEFEAPFGPIGRLAEKLVLGRYLQRLIKTRNRHLADDSSLE